MKFAPKYPMPMDDGNIPLDTKKCPLDVNNCEI